MANLESDLPGGIQAICIRYILPEELLPAFSKWAANPLRDRRGTPYLIEENQVPVAYNRDFGGYEIPTSAAQLLMLAGMEIIIAPNASKDSKDYYAESTRKMIEGKTGHTFSISESIPRHHFLLIAALRSVRDGCISICTIPATMVDCYTVSEYDGAESIHVHAATRLQVYLEALGNVDRMSDKQRRLHLKRLKTFAQENRVYIEAEERDSWSEGRTQMNTL